MSVVENQCYSAISLSGRRYAPCASQQANKDGYAENGVAKYGQAFKESGGSDEEASLWVVGHRHAKACHEAADEQCCDDREDGPDAPLWFSSKAYR